MLRRDAQGCSGMPKMPHLSIPVCGVNMTELCSARHPPLKPTRSHPSHPSSPRSRRRPIVILSPAAQAVHSCINNSRSFYSVSFFFSGFRPHFPCHVSARVSQCHPSKAVFRRYFHFSRCQDQLDPAVSPQTSTCLGLETAIPTSQGTIAQSHTVFLVTPSSVLRPLNAP